MAQQDYVIGIDCSTTATKAVVWDREGNAVAEGRATFDLSSPQPDWGEQNAEDWWESTKTALKRASQVVDTRRIGAIGITHQRETFVCLNEEDHAIRPAILWLDSRARDEVEKYGTEQVHKVTGKPPQDEVGTAGRPGTPPAMRTTTTAMVINQPRTSFRPQSCGRTDTPRSPRISTQTRAARHRSDGG